MRDDRKRTIELTPEQIAFIGASLDYSARALRDYDHDPADREWATGHRRDQEEMIASIQEALADGPATVQ
jgi:hypothetical protein